MDPTRHLPATVANTETATPPSRRRRRAAAAATVIASFAAVTAGSAAADDPPADVADCAPITCAAQYIAMPTSTLSALVVVQARAGRGTGFEIVLELLDAAEHTKLAGVSGPAEFNVFQVRQIMQRHDDVADLIMSYAISGLLPPR